MNKEEIVKYISKEICKEYPNQIKRFSVDDLEKLSNEVISWLRGSDPITLIEPEEHRWYILSTGIYKFGDKYFGIPYYSTLGDTSAKEMDLFPTIDELIEMEPKEKTIITYVPKK